MKIIENENENMSGYTNQLQQVKLLVDKYRDNHSQYRRNTYNETEVRVDFVTPFLQALGWDVHNEKGLPQHLREVKHEASVMVVVNEQQSQKRPDYSFRAGTELCFFLEAKKPSVDIITAREPAFQLRRYGWSGNLKISILTNFSDLLIYDSTIRPTEGDVASVALIAHYNYQDYVDKFPEIYGLISRESVANGTFDQKFKQIETSLMKEPFDSYFLSQIKRRRNILSEDIAKLNNIHNDQDLNIYVQKILNRIVFLRICEDRNFEKYEALKSIKSYEQLKKMFVVSDQKYNSGLFDLIDEQALAVSDKAILLIFKDLYYPYNSYEFSVVDPYIIGQIYELFLEEIAIVKSDRKIEFVKKPEAIDSQGAVNTPKNITDVVVNETLSSLYTDKKPEDVENLKIVDICCGSGNFLLSAFEFITNYYINYFSKNQWDQALRSGKIYETVGGQNLELSYEIKRKILKNNIYGVDIDPLAAEVTKFSLMLKLLENVCVEELQNFVATQQKKFYQI